MKLLALGVGAAFAAFGLTFRGPRARFWDRMTATGLVLGLVLAWLGFTQSSLLPGANHAIVQIVHFLLGAAAVAFGEIVGGRLRRAAALAQTSA